MTKNKTLPPRENVEWKSRIDLAKARPIAEQVSGGTPEHLRQVDTYFRCQTGRLKLREINGSFAQLISYQRPDLASARNSQYYLVDAPDPQLLKTALSAALGVWMVIVKDREVYLWENVRIHLDHVEKLGEFVEFEAVTTETVNCGRAAEQVAEFVRRFGLTHDDALAGSYSDLAVSLAAKPSR